VVGSRKNQFAHAELLDSPQPLKFSGIDQIPEQAIAGRILERNQLVHRISDDFGPGSSHGGAPVRKFVNRS
jgi:hypothetical protein